jgi:ABC-type transport system involved in cytochrome c biogenesis permease subunit
MAAIDITERGADSPRPRSAPVTGRPKPSAIEQLLMPLASLKLTVTVFALGIFLIFVGTLAQVDQDIWQVMNHYFRAFFVWVPFQVFFPPAFFPSRPHVGGSFPYPGGFTLLTIALVNLTAAHGLRFKVQAKGTRLTAGLLVTALGIAMTVLVILGGSNKDGILEVTWIEWSTLWNVFLGLMVAGWVAALVGLVRLEPKRRIERVSLGIVVIGLGALLATLFYQGDAARLGDSAMRILWQLMKGATAALVLLGGCALLFKKRAGVVLLHTGVALLMLNELIVYSLHVEARMSIVEGQTVNWVQDTRHLELALIDPSDPKSDDVTVIPESMLVAGKRISDKQLPVDVELVRFVPNSDLRKLREGEKPEATEGEGAHLAIEELRPGSGTDTDSSVDFASAVVKFYRHGQDKPLGTWVLSQLFSLRDIPQQVTVGDKTYDAYLRFQRIYKPYAIKLDDVSQTTYLGTPTPRDYSSIVRIVDPELDIDRGNVRIWMNNPLRFAGETFYQSGYHADPKTGVEGTTLQVVSNTGWMIPYVACTIIAVGMLAHFMVTLSRFLTRRNTATIPPTKARGQAAKVREPSGSWTSWVVPAAIALVFAGWAFSKARMPKPTPDTMNLEAFGALPLAYEGRVKPFDTLARTTLRAVSGREYYRETPKEEKADKTLGERMTGSLPPKHSAIEWLLELIADPGKAADARVFRIENFDVLNTLGLPQRENFRYAIDEFREHGNRFEAEVSQARAKSKADKGSLTVYEKKLLEFDGKLRVYLALDAAFHPREVPDFPTPEELEANPEESRKRLMASMQRVRASVDDLRKAQVPLAVPTSDADNPWLPYANGVVEAYVQRAIGQKPSDAVLLLATIIHAYAENDTKTFNEAVEKYRQYLDVHPPKYADVSQSTYDQIAEWKLTHLLGFNDSPFLKSDFEAAFNHWDPFSIAWYGYFFAFVLTALSWLGWTKTLNRSALAVIAVSFLIHTIALASRIYISGRPPVTNLYSSAIFIGWGAVLIGMVFEGMYHLGIGNLVAAVAGFATLQIAHMLAVSNGGDTFVVLQAVLDTQFWLATHVTCITLGYATTYVTGLLGLIYIVRGVLTPSLRPETGKDLARMIYGTLCFAIFFSAVGTILGGLWADDSWGRFWGWDPKENGALIIVIWNALVLHARWGAMVGDRGMAVLAVGGNIVTSWSWFGVNELGIGLHSYGFTEGVLLALGVFCLSQLAIIALGMVPRERWWSTRALGA